MSLGGDRDPSAGGRQRIRVFRRHLAIYLAATVVLLALNLTLAPTHPLTIFPLFLWGIVVALHAARVMGLLGR